MATLPVFEIFNSLSGEIGMVPQGTPITFLRLGGCNMVCPWCDTPKTQSVQGSVAMDINDILYEIENSSKRTNPRKTLLITGGEPLLYQDKGLNDLCTRLKNWGWSIACESNGTILPSVPAIDFWILDYKVGFKSQMLDMQEYAGIQNSCVKGIFSDREEFEQCVQFFMRIQEYCDTAIFTTPPTFAVSCVGPVSPKKVAIWVTNETRANLAMNVQLHKILGVA